MSNTPHNWKTGDTVTAERLNNMPFIIHLTDGQAGSSDNQYVYTCPVSIAEIKEAASNGRTIIYDGVYTIEDEWGGYDSNFHAWADYFTADDELGVIYAYGVQMSDSGLTTIYVEHEVQGNEIYVTISPYGEGMVDVRLSGTGGEMTANMTANEVMQLLNSGVHVEYKYVNASITKYFHISEINSGVITATRTYTDATTGEVKVETFVHSD